MLWHTSGFTGRLPNSPNDPTQTCFSSESPSPSHRWRARRDSPVATHGAVSCERTGQTTGRAIKTKTTSARVLLAVEIEEEGHGERVEHDVERAVASRDEQRRRRDELDNAADP